jgi:methyl-accepting chemotaxis protein
MNDGCGGDEKSFRSVGFTMKNWMRNAKISKKLTVSFLFTTILSIIIGAVGVYSLVTLMQNQNKTFSKCTIGVMFSNQMLTDMNTVNINIRDMYVNFDNINQDKKTYFIQIDAAFKELDQAIAQYQKTIVDKSDQANFDNSAKPYADFKTAINDIITAAKDGKSIEEIGKMIRSTKTITTTAAQSFTSIVTYKQTLATRRISTDTETSTMSTYVLIGITVVAIVLAQLLRVRITHLIAPQMKKFAAFAQLLAAGDVDVSKVIDEKDKLWALRKDEVGVLADCFNKVIESTTVMAAQTRAIADGDLTTEVTVRSEFDVQGKALDELVRKFRELTLSIIEASEHVSAGSATVSDSSTSLAQGASVQAASIQELSASIQEIASKTTLNAENAQTANKLAVDASTDAETGNRQMKEMLGAMDEINNSSGSISKIIKVIDDIAFQTNILALNAAVEAARAGQHGKGFAVVAEEVRNLAAKSASAANDTTSLIEGSMRTVEKGTVIAKKTADALEEIVGKVTKAAGLIEAIALSSEEQAAAIGQINQGINQVSQVIQSTAAMAEESAATSEELSGQAEILQEQTAYFKVGKSGVPDDDDEAPEKGRRVSDTVHMLPAPSSDDGDLETE